MSRMPSARVRARRLEDDVADGVAPDGAFAPRRLHRAEHLGRAAEEEPDVRDGRHGEAAAVAAAAAVGALVLLVRVGLAGARRGLRRAERGVLVGEEARELLLVLLARVVLVEVLPRVLIFFDS